MKATMELTYSHLCSTAQRGSVCALSYLNIFIFLLGILANIPPLSIHGNWNYDTTIPIAKAEACAEAHLSPIYSFTVKLC